MTNIEQQIYRILLEDVIERRQAVAQTFIPKERRHLLADEEYTARCDKYQKRTEEIKLFTENLHLLLR